MKKLFLISLLVSVGILQSLAFDYTDERGVTWGWEKFDNTSAQITSASGYGNEVVIPEKVYNGTKEYTVTSITFTFQDNKTLEKVTWPSTVTEIPGSMFYKCSNLKTVENIKKVTTIGYDAFSCCSKLQNVNTSICTYIRDNAFCGCSSMTEVNLSACKEIGASAFSGCTKLENVIGLEKFKSIPKGAFSGTGIKSVDLPQCTTIGLSAFSGCSSLQSVNLPVCISIDDGGYYQNGAFQNCTNLTDLKLPQCTTIGDYAFNGCSSLQSVDLPVCTTIGSYAFDGCSSLQSVELPKVEGVGNNAFWKSGITKISLSETLKNMGYQCFDKVAEYTFNGTQPAALYEYESYHAFDGVPFVIRVPESAVDAYKTADVWKNYADKIFSIGDQLDYDVTTTAMDNQSGLEQAIGATNMKKVVSLKATGTINGYDIFMIRTKMANLHYLDLTDADIVANGFAYYENNSTTDNVVGDNSFCKLDNLVTLKLPKNAVTIGNFAVGNCSSLESVDFPKNLKNIEDFSFKGCSKLDNVVLPDGLESIGDNSFENCI